MATGPIFFVRVLQLVSAVICILILESRLILVLGIAIGGVAKFDDVLINEPSLDYLVFVVFHLLSPVSQGRLAG